MNRLDDYVLAPCSLCKAGPFQDCVKVRGKRKGSRADQPHAERAYAYWRSTHGKWE